MSREYFRRNFVFLTLDGLLFFLGMVFVSYESVMPVFLARLGGSKTAIAMVPVAVALGLNLPSILAARRIEAMDRKIPYIRLVGMMQRFPYPVVAVVILLLATSSPSWVVVAVLAGIAASTACAGLIIPAFFDVVATTIPVEYRGRLFAMRSVLSYLFGIGGGLLVRYVLDAVAFPGNYALLYGLASLVLYLGWVAFLFVKEPRVAPVREPAVERGPVLREAMVLLRSNRSFTLYIVSRAFLIVSFAGTAFFPVYLVETHGLPDSITGVFALITAATFVVVNPALGWLADRKGYKPVFIVSFISLGTASLLGAANLATPGAFVLIVLTALSQSVNMFAFNMTVEFAPPGQVPTYIGVSGLIIGLAALLALLVGQLVDRFGYAAVFWVTGVTAVLGLLVMQFGVEEPRVAQRRLNQPDTPI